MGIYRVGKFQIVKQIHGRNLYGPSRMRVLRCGVPNKRPESLAPQMRFSFGLCHCLTSPSCIREAGFFIPKD